MNASNFTRTQASVLNIINKAFGNPVQITRAQIKELVDAGDFRWPYWITDHKHGYVVKRGLFNMPDKLGQEAPKVIVATKWYAIDPKGSTVIVSADTPMTASEATTRMIAFRSKAKKATAWIMSAPIQPVPEAGL